MPWLASPLSSAFRLLGGWREREREAIARRRLNNPRASTLSCHALPVLNKGSEFRPRSEQPGVPVFRAPYPQSWALCPGSFPTKVASPPKIQAAGGGGRQGPTSISIAEGHTHLDGRWTWPRAAQVPLGCREQPALHFSMEMLPFDLYQVTVLLLQACHCMWCLYYKHSLWQHGQGWIPAQNQNVPKQIKIGSGAQVEVECNSQAQTSNS